MILYQEQVKARAKVGKAILTRQEHSKGLRNPAIAPHRRQREAPYPQHQVL